jgi:hypothetical protein
MLKQKTQGRTSDNDHDPVDRTRFRPQLLGHHRLRPQPQCLGIRDGSSSGHEAIGLCSEAPQICEGREETVNKSRPKTTTDGGRKQSFAEVGGPSSSRPSPAVVNPLTSLYFGAHYVVFTP